MSRCFVVGLLLLVGALLGPVGASPARAADPTLYHIINSVHADANFSMVDPDAGIQTDVWISTSKARYLPQPPGGRAESQYLTTVDIFVSDVGTEVVVPMAGGGGGGGGYLAIWSGQVQLPPVIPMNLSGASLTATFELTDDVSGGTATAIMDLAWAPAGPIDHYTVSLGEHWPHLGMVHGNTNAKIRDATVTGSITLQGEELIAGVSGAGHIESLKWNCIENTNPHSPGEVGSCTLGG